MSMFTVPAPHEAGWTLVNQDTGLGVVWSDDIEHLGHLAEDMARATRGTYTLSAGRVGNAHVTGNE